MTLSRPERELALDDELAETVNGAFDAGHALILAYVEPTGAPRMSHRGTTQVYSPTQLAIWVRKREGGFLDAVAENPAVALFYSDLTVPRLISFSGRARVVDEEDVRERVYANSPEKEQGRDPEKAGVPVIIDLDFVEQVDRSGGFVMKR